MKRLIPFVMLGLAFVLSACATPGPVTRNAPLDLTPGQVEAAPAAAQAQDWRLESLVIDVPASLTVSEANGIKPRADIVWREDPIGDRHAQVAEVMREPLEGMLSLMDGDVPVQVHLIMTRFHAVTERTRYTLGGQHEIEFDLTVRHAETGEVFRGPEHVDLTFRALGGAEAIASEQRGIYQRDRIHARLRQWVTEAFGVTVPLASLEADPAAPPAPVVQ